MVGATALNTALLPVRIGVSLFTSIVYYQVLPKGEVGVLLLLQNLANTLGTYVDFGIERTLPRFLPEMEERRGRFGVTRLIGKALFAKVAILVPVAVALFLLATPLAHSLGGKTARRLGRHGRPREQSRGGGARPGPREGRPRRTPSRAKSRRGVISSWARWSSSWSGAPSTTCSCSR